LIDYERAEQPAGAEGKRGERASYSQASDDSGEQSFKRGPIIVRWFCPSGDGSIREGTVRERAVRDDGTIRDEGTIGGAGTIRGGTIMHLGTMLALRGKADRSRAVRCSAFRAISLLFAALISLGATIAVAQDRPHIVYILADDLGRKDVGFNGSPVRTPNLDSLAGTGVVFNAFYSQPFSSQARAALLTGRYPMRYGLQTGSIGPSSQYGLPTQERTLAQALKEAGYETALIGKWQLGHARPEMWPTRRGFDYFYGTLSGNVGVQLGKTSDGDWRRNEQPLQEDGFVTTLLARDAVARIENHESRSPLFLMLSLTQPAAPYGAPQAFVDGYRDVPDEARRQYAASVTALDDAVGQVVKALERKNMLQQTLIVFHSDNGGAIPMRFPTGDGDVDKLAADNDLYREGKGSLYEGGVRVVALAHWPDRLKKSVVTSMVHVTDLYPTLLKLAGGKLEQPKKLDGFDVWGAITAATVNPRREMLINVEDVRGAIRVGEWKLIARATLPSRIELFNIANDPGETTNQAEAYPERVRELYGKLNGYAYDMAPPGYLVEEASRGKRGEAPVYWGQNAPRR
jgi:arylsulfatase A-like enzyme